MAEVPSLQHKRQNPASPPSQKGRRRIKRHSLNRHTQPLNSKGRKSLPLRLHPLPFQTGNNHSRMNNKHTSHPIPLLPKRGIQQSEPIRQLQRSIPKHRLGALAMQPRRVVIDLHLIEHIHVSLAGQLGRSHLI